MKTLEIPKHQEIIFLLHPCMFRPRSTHACSENDMLHIQTEKIQNLVFVNVKPNEQQYYWWINSEVRYIICKLH